MHIVMSSQTQCIKPSAFELMAAPVTSVTCDGSERKNHLQSSITTKEQQRNAPNNNRRPEVTSQMKKEEWVSDPSVQEFNRWKESTLSKTDLSKKGSVDEEIYDLVAYINSKPDYFTTSSCSGRIIICSDDPFLTEKQNGNKKTNCKKQCKWYLVSHKPVDPSHAVESLVEVQGSSKLKFEPFVLHVQCRTLNHAKMLHQVAMSTGYRNSGISFGKGGRKIVAAVRATACLEVPLTDSEGSRLTNDTYVTHATNLANKKLEINFKAVDGFERALRSKLEEDHSSKQEPKPLPGESRVYRRKRRIIMVPCTRTEAEFCDLDSIAALLSEDGS